ncbi:hypothetical protein H8356DRAFT_1349587 [Neocallimastix lanati (nom. inval.)]|nr:hypothetical protein H8356DRAFT_1349587 [Neocallimastix sp. JGI-2020a]
MTKSGNSTTSESSSNTSAKYNKSNNQRTVLFEVEHPNSDLKLFPEEKEELESDNNGKFPYNFNSEPIFKPIPPRFTFCHKNGKGSKRNFKSYNVNHEEQNNSDSDSDSDSVPDPSFDFYSNITINIIENNYNSISIIPIET